MKKIYIVSLAILMMLSLVFISESSSSNNPLSVKAQMTTMKAQTMQTSQPRSGRVIVRRKNRSLASKTYRGGRYVVRRVWDGTKYVSRKVWVGTKYAGRKTYQGGKYVGRKTVKGTRYTAHKTKRGTKAVISRTKKIITGQ